MAQREWANALLFACLALGAFFLFIGCSADGAALFERERCRSCHLFKGSGGNLAPDLTFVSDIRSDRWIKRQIKNPSANNQQARMPDFGHLSRSDIRALLAFLKS